MPRIPLYNQGQGPAVQLATGPLSRRADVGAFTAPGQALASFGEKASQIAFQFGEAELAEIEVVIEFFHVRLVFVVSIPLGCAQEQRCL